MRNLLILLSLLFLALTPVGAMGNVIRDSEIEEVIEDTISPLRKNSGLLDLKIVLLAENTPNAFTAGGETIYVSSGLLIDYPDPDVLRGVIAHEIGHILGKHIVRRQEIIDNYSKASFAATAVGIATAISGGTAEGLAISLSAMHMADRKVLAYSRGYESAADHQAMRILDKSGHSAVGMIKFFEKMRLQTSQMFTNPYDRSHPMSKDRLLILKSFTKRSKFTASQNNDDLKYRFRRAAAKMAAYTLDLDKILDCTFEDNLDELTHYMKAIKCYRIGNFDDAMNHVNRLLIYKPKDPYYHELKGQIYFEAGKNMSLHEYDMAIEVKPDDVLLRLGRAIIGITKYKDEPYGLTNYYRDLIYVTEKEPKNLLGLFYLSTYYELKGLKGKSYLNAARMAVVYGNRPNARRLAKAAMKEFIKNSPDWYKASDIYEQTNQ